jgi:hypothetical protein
MVLKSIAALGFAHFLPGLFLAKLFSLGRTREEQLVIAAILGGPLAALLFLAVLLSGIDAVFWVTLSLLALGALFLPSRKRLALEWPGSTLAFLGAVLAAVVVPYLLTTGSLYRVDEAGGLLLDRSLQRDALFHLGIARSLETSYPPRLLSVSGEPIGYHPGFHLQLALWSRFFGIAPEDGLIRVGAVFYLALYVLGAYLLSRRLFEREGARRLSAILVLASGFGFAFFSRPSVDWWSLTFMDWALVSIFLANPLLAALPLLFAGAALLHDYRETGSSGPLAAGASLLSFVFFVKMFLGAQALAALFLAALFSRGDRRTWIAFAATAASAFGVVLHTALAAAGSNTDVGFRPLEIVRYAMEKLAFGASVDALAVVGSFAWPKGGFFLVAGATLLWFVGFLGLRLLGLRSALRDLASRSFLPSFVAWFALLGFPLSLVLRIAPAEAQGLSRLEALNDAGWFATASGILLWFPTARALSALRPFVAGLAVLTLALPSTAQHFFHAASQGADRIPPHRVEAVLQAERLSSPASIWVEPPDRARPSLVAYFAGRPTVYDSYVGYDYMFLGRDDIDYRRHAVAQFWSSADPAYLAWFLKRYRVGFVWNEGRELGARDLLLPEFRNDEVELARVDANAVERALRLPMTGLDSVPMGGRGQPYFGAGWNRSRGNQRELPPGRAKLYLPFDRAIELDFLAELEGHGLRVDGNPPVAVAEDRARFAVTRRPAGGLHAIDVEWSGPSPLIVRGIEIRAVVP